MFSSQHHVGQLMTACYSSSRGSDALFCTHTAPGQCTLKILKLGQNMLSWEDMPMVHCLPMLPHALPAQAILKASCFFEGNNLLHLMSSGPVRDPALKKKIGCMALEEWYLRLFSALHKCVYTCPHIHIHTCAPI